jgi:hypothetical protein
LSEQCTLLLHCPLTKRPAKLQHYSIRNADMKLRMYRACRHVEARSVYILLLLVVRIQIQSRAQGARIHVCYSPCLLASAWGRLVDDRPASYAEGDGGTLAEWHWHGSARAWPIHILQGQVTVPGFCLSVMRSTRHPIALNP